jgi:hypothetical protein
MAERKEKMTELEPATHFEDLTNIALRIK